ncbi:hypothetical protein SAMN02910298_02264 [Pseudobutyrivibrio sp. YE44]|uniref:hypothetical protein n=1 Tax=Pseudobutyrivibrio sp. YE44 TaxID=1520802 RepID=UPI000888EF9E|nr:hypothetical protein [Pseudobutyrivibrio sp. YE44]SDB45229.1 hypothetical protein SAMN02910298_02264 [Pseudobutyrivibrio sp. YE44]
MKKRMLVLMMTMAMSASIIGCGANSVSESEVSNLNENTTTENSTDADSTATDNKAEDNSASSQESSSIEGIWGSNSISGENENFPATYYVQFTDSTVDYGHMTDDGNFEIENSYKISSITEISSGIYRVQAETEDGHHFTYQTNEDDNTIMDYFSTWEESEFDDNYSASESLSKCQ